MRKWILTASAAALAAALSGCSATSVPVVGNMTPIPTETVTVTPSPTETPIAIITTAPSGQTVTPAPVSLTPIAEADEQLKSIGKKEEGELILKVNLVNRTGSPITGIQLIPSAAGSSREEWEYNLLKGGDVFADKEERILYRDTTYVPADENGEKLYDLRLFYEDAPSYLMTKVPLGDMEEGVIYREFGVSYIVYLSASQHTQLSTKEQELSAEELRRQSEDYDREAREEDYEEEYDEDDYGDEGDYDEDTDEDDDDYEEYGDEDWEAYEEDED